MTKTYEVQTGGKLYLAGEYAVLIPGQTALIQFIPIYMTATIRASSSYQLQSDMFNYGVDLEPDAGYALIQQTAAVVNDYLQALGHELQPFSLKLTGKMERQGKKLGIGSSGSVVILTIKAMAELYQLMLSPDQVFRLACYVLLKNGDNGSMGDLACIAYEGLIAFTSFDREQVRDLIEQVDLLTVLRADWGYRIEPVVVNLPCDFLVGWTKEPAISKDLIKLVTSSISQEFLNQTQTAVLALRQGLETGNHATVRLQLGKVGQLLADLHPAIYSNKLKDLVEAGQGLDVVCKSSGAGGGDCGLALSFDKKASQHLIARWQELAIDLLWQEELA